jgi:hypothetical protein
MRRSACRTKSEIAISGKPGLRKQARELGFGSDY